MYIAIAEAGLDCWGCVGTVATYLTIAFAAACALALAFGLCFASGRQRSNAEDEMDRRENVIDTVRRQQAAAEKVVRRRVNDLGADELRVDLGAGDA